MASSFLRGRTASDESAELGAVVTAGVVVGAGVVAELLPSMCAVFSGLGGLCRTGRIRGRRTAIPAARMTTAIMIQKERERCAGRFEGGISGAMDTPAGGGLDSSV